MVNYQVVADKLATIQKKVEGEFYAALRGPNTEAYKVHPLRLKLEWLDVELAAARKRAA